MEDKFLEASSAGARPVVASLAEEHTEGSGYFVTSGLAGWSSKASFVVYEVDDDGEPVAGTETDWIGVVSNNSLQDLVLTAGNDRNYLPTNTVIVATETAGGRNLLVEGLKSLHASATAGIAGNKSRIEALENGTGIEDSSIKPSKLETKNGVMTIVLKTNFTAPNETRIPLVLDAVIGVSHGEGLSYSSNQIVIGQGVSKVLVSAAAFSNPASSPYLWVAIKKNSGEVATQIDTTPAGTSFRGVSFAPILVDATAGDAFYLVSKESGVCRSRETYLTVQVVG